MLCQSRISLLTNNGCPGSGASCLAGDFFKELAMQRICAWCDKPMGFKEGPANEVSHGICEECLVVQMAAKMVGVSRVVRSDDA